MGLAFARIVAIMLGLCLSLAGVTLLREAWYDWSVRARAVAISEAVLGTTIVLLAIGWAWGCWVVLAVMAKTFP
jgi:hypothetical protein